MFSLCFTGKSLVYEPTTTSETCQFTAESFVRPGIIRKGQGIQLASVYTQYIHGWMFL